MRYSKIPDRKIYADDHRVPAIRHLLDGPNQRALDNVARMTAEARRRNLEPAHWLGMVIEALHSPELQHSGFPPLR
jgi:hypothetical protein